MVNRLALIYPSQYNERYYSELLYGPLALAYVAAYTPAHWHTQMYDEYIDEYVDPRSINADLVAMSALTPNIVRAYYLADKLRERGIKVVCGGAHVSALPDEALQHFDAVVRGEAEPVWPQLIADFENGNLQPVYDGGMSCPVDDIRLPRRDLIHPDYQFPTILTSKGCPFSCDYCFLSIFPRNKYRVLPVDAIIEDMERVAKQTNFLAIVVDENISGYSSSDYENRVDLFERMIRKKIKFIWGAQSTVDIYKKPELLELMYRAGCRGLFLGLEAPDNERLGEQVNKNFATRIDYKTAIKEIHRHRIAVIGSFILGMDNQDRHYARNLPKLMKRLKVDYPRVFFLTAWPGTPLYQRLNEENRIIDGWNHIRKDIPSLKYLNFHEEEILEAERYIYKNIFTLPFILRIIFRWIFKQPAMVKFFLKVLRYHLGSRKYLQRDLQKEKEQQMKKLLEEHFGGTTFAQKETLYKEIGGNYR